MCLSMLTPFRLHGRSLSFHLCNKPTKLCMSIFNTCRSIIVRKYHYSVCVFVSRMDVKRSFWCPHCTSHLLWCGISEFIAMIHCGLVVFLLVLSVCIVNVCLITLLFFVCYGLAIDITCMLIMSVHNTVVIE